MKRRKGLCFAASTLAAVLWLGVSAELAAPWAEGLVGTLPEFYIIFAVSGIALLPGYILSAMFISNLLNSKREPEGEDLWEPVTVLVCARNEEGNVYPTLEKLAGQSYRGRLRVLCVDNGSSDGTRREMERARAAFQTPDRRFEILSCPEPGKARALNAALKRVDTRYFVTVDADTSLDREALRHILDRISASGAACVAGNLLVREAETLVQKMQIYDYLISIAAVKRYQGSYGSTLVAQGAFSAYETEAVRRAGGWDICAGEDIVLTYRLMAQGRVSCYEARAIGYTAVPAGLKALCRQRARWAKGMLEGLRAVAPWRQTGFFPGYFEALNISVIYLDLSYIFGFMAGVLFLLLGHSWLVGWATLLMLPAIGLSSASVYVYQRSLEGIRIKHSLGGAVCFLLFFRAIESVCAVTGYIQAARPKSAAWK